MGLRVEKPSVHKGIDVLIYSIEAGEPGDRPSKANQDAFEGAVTEVSEASRRMFDRLVIRA